MLVLTRKLQQQIKIGDQITVTILRVKGSTVRIGVQAPRDVRVIRGELPKGDGGSDEAACPEPQSPLVVNVEVSPDGIEVDATPVATAPPSADMPQPAHLPLRKIRNRRGNAPLKQMVAACALAK
jgi:carbon storage regulator CsrA